MMTSNTAYGEITYKGTLYTLNGDPELDNVQREAKAVAGATDPEGNEYCIVWDLLDGDYDYLADACDWDNPAEVERV